ncbi:MAG: hypothetical protein U0R51_01510 [Solirubrobacterales bacterium]
MADLESKLRPVAESLLGPGEELRGTCVATQQKTFKGWMVAIVITDDRLVLQKLTRKFEADGEPLSLTRADIASASTGGGGGMGADPSALVLDQVASMLVIRTTAGEKLKLRMMDGGSGGFGKLGGGAIQEQGVRALGEWFAGPG